MRPGKREAEVEAEARDVAYVIKAPYMNKIDACAPTYFYQYQEITPSMTVTTVSMHCSKVNFNSIV